MLPRLFFTHLLERDADAERGDALVAFLDAVGDEAPGVVGRDVRRPNARPERDRVRAQLGGDVYAAPEEVEPTRAVGRAGVDERRAVLAPGIEHVARARLDHDGEVEALEERTHHAELGVRRVIRREMVGVRRERDRAVPELRDDVQRVLEAMMREPVRVVADPEARLGHQRDAAEAPVQRSSASYCL